MHEVFGRAENWFGIALACPIGLSFCDMAFSPRRRLPHGIPSWVDPHREIYFVTINCQVRWHNQLAQPTTAEVLFETVRHRQEQFLWWPHVFLLMPDHLHALLSFPPSDKPIRRIISKWKEWTAKQTGILWQLDFFEHRLRHEESRQQKANYILENPVRQQLVSRPEDWPFVYFGAGMPPKFEA
jgi:REP element-mobilizing transposase RayT